MKSFALSVFLILGVAGQTAKKPPSAGEHEIYKAVIADAANPVKQLQDLETWSLKYPESDYKDERLWFYVSAYNGTNQAAKALEAASALLAQDMRTAFGDPKQVITVLYLTAVNAQKVTNPTAQQLDTGRKAARMLLDFTPAFFTPANQPQGTSDADWAKGRADLDTAARAALVAFALAPGNAALAPNPKDPANCAAAETAFRKAIDEMPESATVAYALAGAMRCQQSTHPEKVSQAIYELARAAALDPEKGGFADVKTRKSVDDYLRAVYMQFHGSDEGLDELRRLAVQSPLPPADFRIKTSSEVAAEKEDQIRDSNPQLAMWMGIRKQLAASDGEQFFETQLKGARVPKLKGVVMDSRPACRPRELTLALSDPKTPEVKIRLDTALAGKIDAGAEIQWEGVGAAFSKEPFLLTQDVERPAVENLRLSPCAPAVKKR